MWIISNYAKCAEAKDWKSFESLLEIYEFLAAGPRRSEIDPVIDYGP